MIGRCSTFKLFTMRPYQRGQFGKPALMGGLLSLRDALTTDAEERFADGCAGDRQLRTDLIHVIRVHTVWKKVRVVRKRDGVVTRIIFCHYNFWHPHGRIGQGGPLSLLAPPQVEMGFENNLGVILPPPSASRPIAPRIIFDRFVVRIELMKTS